MTAKLCDQVRLQVFQLFSDVLLESIRLSHDIQSMKEKIKENKDKVKVNKTLPYLVANVIELLDVDGEDQEEDGANVDLDAQVRAGDR